MKRFVLVLGLLLSSVVNAQDIDDCNWDRFLEGRPLWYTEDLRLSFWLVESNGQVVGHLQDSRSGSWYHLEFTDRTPNGDLLYECRRDFTVYKPTYDNGSIHLDEVEDFEFCPPAPPPALGFRLQELFLSPDGILLVTDTDGIGGYTCALLRAF